MWSFVHNCLVLRYRGLANFLKVRERIEIKAQLLSSNLELSSLKACPYGLLHTLKGMDELDDFTILPK